MDVSDLRAKTILLLMASSGVRIGALPDIRLRHLQKIDNIYKITVYEGSNSQYITFCSPECTSYIDAYLEQRTKNGENLSKERKPNPDNQTAHCTLNAGNETAIEPPGPGPKGPGPGPTVPIPPEPESK